MNQKLNRINDLLHEVKQLVGYGQASSNESQRHLALLTAQADASTSRGASAKGEFKRLHPWPTLRGYVINHVIPLACGAVLTHRATCNGRPLRRSRLRTAESERAVASDVPPLNKILNAPENRGSDASPPDGSCRQGTSLLRLRKSRRPS